MSPTRYEGVSVTTVTPFNEGGSVNYELLDAQTEFLIDGGVKILVVCGNTGEFTSLGIEETQKVIARTVAVVRGRATVIAGVGWSSPIAGELAAGAEAAGADAVMVHHPAHTFISRIALRKYYEQVMARISIDFIPYKRGPEVSDELLHDLVGDKQVAAVKYGHNDVIAFARLVESSTSDVTWICGTAERWAPYFWLAGARGFTSGLAAFAPGKSLALFAALRRSDYSEAMRIVAELAPFEELRQRHHSANNVPAVKEAMRQLGIGTATVRDPLQRLSDEEQGEVARILADWALGSAAFANMPASGGAGASHRPNAAAPAR
jgi:4-hydroxy-tetrahydrodipicolinate synthase